jgi:hypothetical protein
MSNGQTTTPSPIARKIKRNASHCKHQQQNARHFNALHHKALNPKAPYFKAKHCNAVQSNTLQRNAMQCNAMHCPLPLPASKIERQSFSKQNQRTAMRHNATQCHALQRNALQCIAPNEITMNNRMMNKEL